MSVSSPSILAAAANVIKSALEEQRITFDESTTEDVVFALESITSFLHGIPDELTGHTRPLNATTFLNTPLQPWIGADDDVEGRLNWALQTVILELSEDSDSMEARLDDGRRTRIGSAHQALSALLAERC